MKIIIILRVERIEAGNIVCKIFATGRDCGTLTLDVGEYQLFGAALIAGARVMRDDIEIVIDDHIFKEWSKPDCYKCRHRRDNPGDAHSSCGHPKTGLDKATPIDSVMAIFASVGRASPKININAAVELGIQASTHGIRRGWFNWPYNFDPVWLEACNGFEPKAAPKMEG